MTSKPVSKKQPQSIDFDGYTDLFNDVLEHVKSAQLKATMAVNSSMIRLYWEIGSKVAEKQQTAKWGDRFLDVLSRDLRSHFPGAKGYSVTSLKYMRLLANAYNEQELQVVGQIPWRHNQFLLTRLDDNLERLWYAKKSLQNGWSAAILKIQIDNNLYRRQGKAISNFKYTLPPAQSDLAQQALKDPFIFDFISLRENYIERELEDGLVEHVQKTLMELGPGFAFVGRQHHLEVGGDDYYIDLLLYHLHLRCFVVVELKVTKFTPADAGQINFYLRAVDELLRHETDAPTIGLLLCGDKNQLTADWAVRDISRPISVSSYEVNIVDHLPDELQESLPSSEELLARIKRGVGKDVDLPILDPFIQTEEQVNRD